ncbi:23S rRNA (guanosine2251-2'-O)-methyltransferase [Elusimicrobium posterum]|uniref:23S rRNA (guanosine(2251)-2'-O)-methyltransferase RlmB n=1 Tax=Elusimicrobium posterum TaxID=3116653 RepID=UPI003C76BD39
MADNLETIYGIHAVGEALRSRKRRVDQVYVLDSKSGNKAVERVIAMAKRNNVKISRMEDKTMEMMAKGENHQGILAKIEPVKIMRLSKAIDEARENKKELWLAIDEMTDPQNLGSIIRSAACLGFTTILLPSRRTVGLNATVYKVASGAVERVRIVEVANLNTALIDLQEEGFWVYGADMKGKALPNVDYAYPAVLVIGSEGTGIREKTAEHCDEIISIPQVDTMDSLNAASAASIIMYDMYAKMNFKPGKGKK